MVKSEHGSMADYPPNMKLRPLQIALREQDFRVDGLLRAAARPEHPGVVLAIDSQHGPLSYPCDKFTLWRDNLRAIVLGLEALRAWTATGSLPGTSSTSAGCGCPRPRPRSPRPRPPRA